MQIYAGATNEQVIDNVLKETYSKLRPILINERFNNTIDECVKNSLKDNTETDLKNLLDSCSNYSFISFFKDLYLLPKNIDFLSVYLLAILILLCFIIIILSFILANQIVNTS